MTDPIFDLDAARAARLEKIGAPKTFRFGGEIFTLPPELPAEALRALTSDGDHHAFAIGLLGAESAAKFLGHNPSVEDLSALVDHITKIFGFGSPPESSTSNGSSSTNGNRSRRTSSGTTASTSRRRSTAKIASVQGASATS